MFTILVVEDDAPLQRMMSAFLGLNGFSVVGAANGEEALNAIDRVMPDLVIADVMMPVMDGLEAARRIRSGENPLGKTIPILALTANAFLEDMQKSKDAGMNEHLSKPVDIATLEQMVRRFCKKP